MSTPVAEEALAARPDLLYLFKRGLPARPPTPEEAAAYDHRYDYPDYALIPRLAEEGTALAWDGGYAPEPDDTAVIPDDDTMTCLIPEVQP